MANCSILLIMPRSPFVWLLTTNPRTGKIFIVSISITIHYLILRNVNILTDDDDIARQKKMPLCPSQCITSKMFVFDIFPPKLFYFKHTVLLCILLVFGANSKNIASKALPSHTIIASEFYSTYPQDVVQVLCLPPTTLNPSMNAFVHPYSVFYVVFISQIIFFLLTTSIPIFILRAICTHTGGRYCTHDISIVFIFYHFLIFIFTTYLINFLIYLDIFFLTLHLYFYIDLIALIVLYVLYFL